MNEVKVLKDGDITWVNGFKSSGVVADIKGNGGDKKDLAIIYCEKECVTAAVFTTNKVRSRTIDVNRENLSKGNINAIVVNSGNANACVGKKGYMDALRMTEITAENLGLDKEKVLVCSTGVIGVQLPMEKLEKSIPKAVKEIKDNGGKDTIEAIMTTDLVKKHIAVEFETENGEKIRIGGIAKGSGMIHPNMATLLGFITTDIDIDKELLQNTLKDITDKTFNMISVDRDTSTNDSLIIMSNGFANNQKVTDKNSIDYLRFKNALNFVMEHLAKSIARDGEGATKLIEVKVLNADSDKDAKNIGKSVITSPLVKTAVYGEDANWGRIIMAIGYSDAEVEEGTIDIFVGDIKVCENGIGVLESEVEINKELKKDEIVITIDIKLGEATARVWGCDLSYDYIKINADYRS
ncbi:bifunctional glutamate N-acetyltransferase/amino-acid acetyltransferase ArgJ [Haliovirga abyssi]|uniref:Arginine biosynthesis bifunctional protein ArgJ n=1 Tax=Haliovirga abyssi TaxID=2996794 RepID=A0AAU9DV25_9FUSO|nr:bifunctional glutamate N-acetyltransferase/amino-acid acetyltransferase ArgJ [Haliovirga abyssi]BDU51159.1 arginine biosynthesis bifunctional protein ArgJ 1 [Haliovirga abyssi]